MRPGFESWRRRHMWVEFCCWFSPLLREVFLRVHRFSPLLKNQHFQIPIRSGTHGHVSTSSYELLRAPWVNKLQFTAKETEKGVYKDFHFGGVVLNFLKHFWVKMGKFLFDCFFVKIEGKKMFDEVLAGKKDRKERL